jgi:Pyruvate/2-oxoacid:ferredoxin oxidoreductase delta subunit
VTSKKMEITRLEELPVMPVTLGDMSFNRTGLWRFLTPVIKERTAPCRLACPLGMPSPAFINDLIATDVNQALARILEINPLPGVTGRLCYHPCQTDCLRRELDHPVQIQMLERYVADTAENPYVEVENQGMKERVAVLGAGPLGLAAAYFLGRAGLNVTVFDPLDRPGGFLTGLDEKKLPAEVLDRETARLASIAGLDMKLNADPESFEAENPGTDWNLILHDQTAHPADSREATRLVRLADMLSASHTVMNTGSLAPEQGYKASQAALAVAAGRELAVKAIEALGVETDSPAGSSHSSTAPVPRDEMRLELLAAQAGSEAGFKDGDISPTRAREEAERCFSCGQCNQCGQCLLFCPDVSIRMDEKRQTPVVDLEHCKGCGICAHTCPRRAIVMERVS